MVSRENEFRNGNILIMEKLIEKLEQYIEFLNKTSQQPTLIASAHGWKCPQEDIEKGIIFRKQIEELKL